MGVKRSRRGRNAHSIAIRKFWDILPLHRCGVLAMTADIDIWRAANLLISQHGENAEVVAAQRADVMLERCDPEGWLVWLRIKRAIVELQAAPARKPN